MWGCCGVCREEKFDLQWQRHHYEHPDETSDSSSCGATTWRLQWQHRHQEHPDEHSDSPSYDATSAAPTIATAPPGRPQKHPNGLSDNSSCGENGWAPTLATDHQGHPDMHPDGRSDSSRCDEQVWRLQRQQRWLGHPVENAYKHSDSPSSDGELCTDNGNTITRGTRISTQLAQATRETRPPESSNFCCAQSGHTGSELDLVHLHSLGQCSKAWRQQKLAFMDGPID